MAEKIEEITITYKEEDIELVKELDKEVLTKGAWSTIMFKYQEMNKQTNEYNKPKYSIRRYRKVNGKYIEQSRFNISSDDQAVKMIEILQKWINN